MRTLEKNEREVLEASTELGAPAEFPQWKLAGLAIKIAQTGKAIDDLTVGQLRVICREYGEHIRAMFNANKEWR